MRKKRWISIVVVLILLVVYVQTDVLSPGTNMNKLEKSLLAPQPSFTTQTIKAGSGKAVALINVKGVIQDVGDVFLYDTITYNHQIFLQEIEDVFTNPSIGAVVLAVDSPGGGVYESDEIYQRLSSLKEKADKPLIVSMGSMAASGGYFISMAADQIFASRDTLTGSIGVIISSYNYSGLADKLGIEEIVFKSGTNKDIMNPMRETTPEERQIMQGIVDEYYGYFVDAVAKGRKMDRQQVLKAADGRVYTASQAKSLGLIDEIGDLNAAVAAAAKMMNESDPQVIQYQYENLFWKQFFSMTAPKLDLSGIKQELQNRTGPTVMYLYR